MKKIITRNTENDKNRGHGNNTILKQNMHIRKIRVQYENYLKVF